MIIKNYYNKLVIFFVISLLSLTTLTFIPTVDAICPDDCPSGLVSYWGLDETSAGTVVDCYGSNDGTNNGASIGVPGMVGTAYHFDGEGYVNIPDDDSLSFGDGTFDEPFSISVWVNMDTSTNRQRIVCKADSLWDGEYILTTSGRDYFAFYLTDQSGDRPFIGREWAEKPSLNNWYHLVGTYNGNGMSNGIRLYVDGIQVDDTNWDFDYSAMQNTEKPLYFGKYGDTGFNGMIDEVAIFNIELTSDEVSNLYCRGFNGFSLCDTLVYTGGPQSSDSITLEATLSDSSGVGLLGYDVTFNFDGFLHGPVSTDSNGLASINIGPYAYGDYDVYTYTNCLVSDTVSLTIYDLTADFSWLP